MPLTAGQITAFFENADQMGIPNRTVIKLQEEGIDAPNDLTDFRKETISEVAQNLRRPSGREPNPDPNAAPGSTIPTQPFVFSAKSQERFTIAAELMRYYETVGRAETAGNLMWNPVMKNFNEQWKALVAKKKDDEPEVPKVTKTLTIIKWSESMRDYFHRCIGVRGIPLAYVIRNNVDVPMIGTIQPGSPHSTEHGSVEMELIARALHTHPLYREDNSLVYYKIEEGVRGTQFAASIKPYQRNKNGRGAWLALINQFAGIDKWEAEIKRMEQVLHTQTWKGQGSYPLEKHCAKHRHAYVSMTAAAEHVTYQLPNEHSRVGYLLDSLQTADAGLNAAMASIKTDTANDGMRNDFEQAVTHLLPYDPVLKRRTEKSKRGNAEISSMHADDDAEVSAFGAKKGIGKSGVHLRYHTNKEYQSLNQEQMTELREWRKTPEGQKATTASKRNPPKKHHTNNKKARFDEKALASAVEKRVEERLKALTQANDDEAKEEARIMSVMKKMKAKGVDISAATAGDDVMTATDDAKTASSSVSLKAILKKAKNPSNK